MNILLRFLLLLVLLQIGLGCQKPDHSEAEGQKQKTEQLARENEQLKREIQDLKKQTQTSVSQVQTATVAQTAPHSPLEPSMTLTQMKAEIGPILAGILKKKQEEDKPVKGKATHYTMRTQYRLSSAVYGLVRTGDPDAPFMGKVLVPYEKLLVSAGSSSLYGSGVEEFQFVYRAGTWNLQSDSDR